MASKKSLVIVESPAKANTINKYLGAEYVVKASLGHVKDLPKSKLGVDIENNFEPVYDIIPGKEKVIKEYALGGFGGRAQFLDDFLFTGNDVVYLLEVLFDVHSELALG